MKKIVLKSVFNKGEVLSREQLKKVMGGKGSIINGNCDNECGEDIHCQAFNLGNRCASYVDEQCGIIRICV